MSKRLLIPALIGIVVLGLVIYIATTLIGAVEDSASREYKIVIPSGTSERIAAGEDPGVVPDEIELVLGEKDILVVENRDAVGHSVAGYVIGPGETLRQKFQTSGVYRGECTVHQDAQIQITVREK
jgi:hypothetical protein